MGRSASWVLGTVVAMAAIPATASASATTLNVAAGGSDDATPPTPACTASGTNFTCATVRDAIYFANHDGAGADPTISLGPGTFTLSVGSLEPSVTMTITGAGDQGAGATTIRQTGQFSVIAGGSGAALTVSDVVLTGGNATGTTPVTPGANGGGVAGGGIGVDAPLTLTSVSITKNSVTGGNGSDQGAATSGGNGGLAAGAAIEAPGLTMTDSSVSANVATAGTGGSGSNPGTGGLAGGTIDASGPVTITSSSITGNMATGGTGGADTGAGAGAVGGDAKGGGVAMLTPGAGSITGSSIETNTVTGGMGGSAVAAGQNGGAGGVASAAGVLAGAASNAIDSSTISGNTLTAGAGGAATGAGGQGGAGGLAFGGGLAILKPTTVSNTTVDGNTIDAGAPGDDTTAASFGGNGVVIYGGGIADGQPGTTGSGAPLSVSGSTISANNLYGRLGGLGPGSETGFTSSAAGGGLSVVQGATATLLNSTLAGDQANVPFVNFGTSYGGAIHADGTGTTLGLYSDTIDGSLASAATINGTSIHGGDSAAITIRDSVIADPKPSGGDPGGSTSCVVDSGAVITDGGHNLEDDAAGSCGVDTPAKGDVAPARPLLPAALGTNGGPTETLAPALGSPLIRAGGSCVNPLASGSPALTVDQRGAPRGATCDIGAFQTEPLTISGVPVIAGTPQVGHTLTCASGSSAITGDGALSAAGAIGPPAVTYAWLRDGAGITGAAGKTYVVATADLGHSLRCTETATGAYGHGSATSPAIKISLLSLTKVSQSHAKWLAKKRHGRHLPPVGTSFSFTLNTPARVTFTFTESVTGRKVGRRCVARTRRNARDRSCRLTVTVGTFAVNGKTGANKVTFTGKLGRHHLAAGSYEVTLSSGRVRSKPLRFTIAR